MAKQGRYFRPKDSAVKGTGWDSVLERDFQERLEKDFVPFTFKPPAIPYTVDKKYLPDFAIHKGGDFPVTYVECKGYFQDSEEAAKYIWIRKNLPEGEKLVFFFENPDTKMHYLKARADGTKQTMREWAERNKFEWYSMETLGDLIND